MRPPASTDIPLRLLSSVLITLAAFYVLAGVVVMLWLSPKVPYADGWRLLGKLASQPFPANLWQADNGHREVLPNLVRLIELRAFAANQWMQIIVGAALALSTFVVLVRAMRLSATGRLQGLASICCTALLLFWLGSQRTLAHGNETVHAYLITLCLAGGLALVQRGDSRSLLMAIVLGIVATFSFGTGLATFAAFAAVLWLQRRGLRAWLLLGAGGVLAGILYLAGNAGASQLQLAPLAQASLLLRWLSAPFAYAMWPAIDIDVAGQVPTALGPAIAVPVARSWEGFFGPFETATWPWMGLGIAGVVSFGILLMRVRRLGQPSSVAVVGLGLSAFALATGMAVAAARATYFTQLHPDQLLATRYVVWSTLFWGGLLLTGVGISTRPRRAAGAVIAVAILLVPSQMWMTQLATRMRAAAERSAAMMANGVVDVGSPIGETVPGELTVAAPALRRAHASVYAWPEIAHLNAPMDAALLQPMQTSDWEVTSVINGITGQPASRVTFRAGSAHRLLIVDPAGVVRGVALPDRSRPGYWLGWSPGIMRNDGLRATALAPR